MQKLEVKITKKNSLFLAKKEIQNYWKKSVCIETTDKEFLLYKDSDSMYKWRIHDILANDNKKVHLVEQDDKIICTSNDEIILSILKETLE